MRRPSSGFTLIEVMLALAILAGAGVSLLLALDQAARQTDHARTTDELQDAARALLAEPAEDDAPPLSGRCPAPHDAVRFERRLEPLEPQPAGEAEPIRLPLQRERLTLTAPDGRQLTLLRLVPEPPQ